jgi:hypothetical protein
MFAPSMWKPEKSSRPPSLTARMLIAAYAGRKAAWRGVSYRIAGDAVDRHRVALASRVHLPADLERPIRRFFGRKALRLDHSLTYRTVNGRNASCGGRRDKH